jgi:acetyl-CoA synthetase
MGRVDDVMNVAGHRLGTAEIESALVSPPGVAEAAVVGPPRAEGPGRGLCLRHAEGGHTATPELKKALSHHVVREIGALAKPDEIRFTDALPKTRSGKIMRRLLKEIATSGVAKGDTTTLEDDRRVGARTLPAPRLIDGTRTGPPRAGWFGRSAGTAVPFHR